MKNTFETVDVSDQTVTNTGNRGRRKENLSIEWILGGVGQGVGPWVIVDEVLVEVFDPLLFSKSDEDFFGFGDVLRHEDEVKREGRRVGIRGGVGVCTPRGFPGLLLNRQRIARCSCLLDNPSISRDNDDLCLEVYA